MGPITVMARRPSLSLPIDPGDILESRGSVTTIARVSAYHSETWRGDAPLGDPPEWAVQVRRFLFWRRVLLEARSQSANLMVGSMFPAG